MAVFILLFLCLLKDIHGQTCVAGSIRLVEGLEMGEGRLEYCSGGVWGTVCNEGWDLTDARVACAELFPGTNLDNVRTNLFYGQADSSQPIHIRNVTCTDSEMTLSACTFQNTMGSTCQHDEDVGLICNITAECTDGSVRLEGGATADEGRVEYCTGGRWGTVCEEMWEPADVAVVCRQLGFPILDNAPRSVPENVPSDGAAERPIVLSSLSCNGSEGQLRDCSRSSDVITGCSHSRDAGARCGCIEGGVRLYDGAAENEGRLEFCQGGVWLFFCLEAITLADATVACRQLGYEPIGDGYMPRILNPFDFPFDRRVLSENTDMSALQFPNRLRCNGMERRLADCPVEDTSNCGIEGFGVRCPIDEIRNRSVCTNGGIRLQDGVISSEIGRVEVCFNGQWGVVCNHIDNFWDNADAAVACRQLGIRGSSQIARLEFPNIFGAQNISEPSFDRSSIRLAILDDLNCTGNELSLFDCQHPGATVENCPSVVSEANLICGISVERCPEEGASIATVPTSNQIFEIASFGRCEPYANLSKLCQNSIPITDYVYITNSDNQITTQSLIAEKLGIVKLVITGEDPECQALVSRIVCGYFFPSCGSQTGIHRPVSVCSNECNYVAETCPQAWSVAQMALGREGFQFNCTVTTELLDNLHGCCSSVNVTVIVPEPPATPTPTTRPSSAADSLLAPLAGGIIAAIVVIAIVLVVVVVCLFMNTVRRKKTVREIQMEVLTSPSMRVVSAHANSTSPRETSPIKTMSVSPSPLSPATFKIRNGSSRRTVVPNQYATVFSVEKELDFSAPLLNPDGGTASNSISSSMIRDLSSDMVIPYCRLNLLDCIGQGEFGVVYKAKYTCTTEENGYEVSTVAVKTLKGFFNESKVDSIMDESLKMKHFVHPNVMGLIGVCLDAGPAPYIVIPYMANGSLLHYLKKERCNVLLSPDVDEDVKIDIRKRLTVMCLQIANGMEYLADKKFVHRDLAARNCMINLHFIIKISDFGLSEDVYSKNYFRQGDSDSNVKLPVKWMALESLNDGIFTEKTDVWSFGVTCWEVFSGGKTPYPGVDPLMLQQMLETGQRLKKPVNAACSSEIFSLMENCWSMNMDIRPTFSEIASTLSDYTETLAGYLDMTFNPFTDEKPAATENGGLDILTHPDQLATLYDKLAKKSKSPRASPRASPRCSPRVSPLPSPTVEEYGLPSIKIQIDSCSPPNY